MKIRRAERAVTDVGHTHQYQMTEYDVTNGTKDSKLVKTNETTCRMNEAQYFEAYDPATDTWYRIDSTQFYAFKTKWAEKAALNNVRQNLRIRRRQNDG
jgi:hypothetical protein